MDPGSPPAGLNIQQLNQVDLAAKIGLAPQMIGAEKQFDPQYQALQLGNLNELLYGTGGTPGATGGGVSDFGGWRNTKTGAWSATIPQRDTSDSSGKRAALWQPVDGAIKAQPGLLALQADAQQKMAESNAAALSTQRSGGVSDFAALGPRFAAAAAAGDPGSAGLLDTMTGQASRELAMGGDMSPEQMRQAQQLMRARQAGMLGGTGSAGDLQEALGVSQFANELRQQRRQFAAQTIGQRQSFYGAPMQTIMGQPLMGQPNMIEQGQGISAVTGRGPFASGVNTQDTYDTNYSGQMANHLSNVQAASKANAQIGQMSSSAAAGAMGAM